MATQEKIERGVRSHSFNTGNIRPADGLFRLTDQALTMRLLLFGTSGCHLCEQAKEIIQDCLSDRFDKWLETIDIAEFEQWQAHYAIRIPVLYDIETQKELGWPFDQKQVNEFIIEISHV